MPKLKVTIDVSPLTLPHKFRGIGAYTKSLVEALKKYQGPDFQLETLEEGKPAKDADLIHYPYFDLFFLTLPLRKSIKTLVTIHDVIPLVFPQAFPPGIKGRIKFLIQKLSLQGASGVITDSKNSKRDIAKYLAYPEEKIHVIPLAPREIFKPIISKKKLFSVSRKYKLPDQFVLYVGDVSYNKNVPGLVRACQKIKVPLVIVGKQAASGSGDFDPTHPENQDLVWLEKNIKLLTIDHKPLTILTGFVPDEDLAAIYNLATVYCQPSFYEGFGLPVLEAMASGCPVVAAETSSLPEVCGQAALMVDPGDYNDLAEGINRVFRDESLRKRLIKSGFKQVEEFSWGKTAGQTLKVYEKVVKEE